MTSNAIRLSIAVLTALAACDDGSDYETEVNPLAASSAVAQIAAIGAGTEAGSPDSAAGAVLQLGSVAQSIIVPVIPESNERRTQAVGSLVGDCTCGASGCVFDGCGDEGGTWTIDGTISVSGDTYGFDLSIEQSTGTDEDHISTSMNTAGEISISAERIDGTVSGGGDTTIVNTDPDGEQTIRASWDWEIDTREIGFDPNRCPVSGSLRASLSADASAQGRSADYSGSGTVAFGPACGDATIQ